MTNDETGDRPAFEYGEHFDIRTFVILSSFVLSSFVIGSLSFAAEAPGSQKPVSGWRESSAVPRPPAVDPPAREAIEAAIGRGVAFLLKCQNKDGSWGSVRINRPGEIYAPVPGAHHAFRAATTALCVSALIDSGLARPDVNAAIDRGQAWLLEHLPKLRRASADTIYNNWGHAYAIEALARLVRRHAADAPLRERLVEQIRQQMDLLDRYECVDGGWCYYDFNAHTQRPSGSSIGFVTATVLVAFHDAKEVVIAPPERLVERGVASIHRQRNPDFSYDYGEYLKYRPRRLINRPAASVGRSQACSLALRLWGDKTVTDEALAAWLDRLSARNLWLDLGRKRPIPHESFFQVAAYFFYYGHYYAARVIDQLPPAQRPWFQDHLAHILLPLEEPDGSWWDFPMYDYHQQYGTAFAVMSLVRCRR
jgi:hypothetical protein